MINYASGINGVFFASATLALRGKVILSLHNTQQKIQPILNPLPHIRSPQLRKRTQKGK